MSTTRKTRVRPVIDHDRCRPHPLRKGDCIEECPENVFELRKLTKKEKQDAVELISDMKQGSENIKKLDDEIKTLDGQIYQICIRIPNIPHESVPIGDSEAYNIEIKSWNKTEEKDFTQRFGRSVIFTDMHKWTTNKIVRTYHRKNQLEDDFKWLTGKLGLSIPPYYVRLDHRIREHAFLCVLGMIFLRYLGRKLLKLRCSAQKIWNELERLRVVLAKDVKTGESQYIVEEMNSIQARAFEVLGLAKFLPMN